MSETKQHTVCIIGGGMSGLIAGAILAKNGYKVTVLEKNHIIGGGLQSFRRSDAVFNTGLQAFCGYENGCLIRQLFKYLTIADKIMVKEFDKNQQHIVWTDKHHCYKLPKGINNAIDYLIKLFPSEEYGLRKLYDSLMEMKNCMDPFYVRKEEPHPVLLKYVDLDAEQFLKQYTTHPEIIKIFDSYGAHSGNALNQLNALAFAFMICAKMQGYYRLEGESLGLAKCLAEVITQYEGKVLADSPVKYIHITDKKKADYIVYADNNTFSADYYISSIAPRLMLDMANEPIFRESTAERIHSFRSDYSEICLHIHLKKDTFPFINSWIHIPSLFGYTNIPHYIYVFTPVNDNQDDFAKTMEIHVPYYYAEFQKWENTFVGQRGEDYINKKEELAHAIIEYVNNSYYPGILDAIDELYIATPLTYRDYYGDPHGALYSQTGVDIPIKTKINNLFMTGQAVFHQFLIGAAIVAVKTTETVMGRNLIEEIAKA